MLNHASFTVGTTPVLLVTLGPKEPKTAVTVVNDDNNSIYVGDSAVTATAGVDKGVTVKKDSQFIFELHAGDSLYARAATTTGANAVSVLYSTLF